MKANALGYILFVIFLVLKLTHHIDWSWWMVAMPLLVLNVFWILGLVVIGYAIKREFGHVLTFLKDHEKG